MGMSVVLQPFYLCISLDFNYSGGKKRRRMMVLSGHSWNTKDLYLHPLTNDYHPMSSSITMVSRWNCLRILKK